MTTEGTKQWSLYIKSYICKKNKAMFIMLAKSLSSQQYAIECAVVSRSPKETFGIYDIPEDPREVSRSLPNASFAFTRASLIACIPLVAFAIFLQKFSSSLSGISTGRAITERRKMRYRGAEVCVVPRVSRRHTTGFPRASAGCHVKIIVVKTLRPQHRRPSSAAPAH